MIIAVIIVNNNLRSTETASGILGVSSVKDMGSEMCFCLSSHYLVFHVVLILVEKSSRKIPEPSDFHLDLIEDPTMWFPAVGGIKAGLS